MWRYLLFLGCLVAFAETPAYKKVTVCGSGCDYPLTASGLYTALKDAANYQDHTACIPYIIEGTGTFPMSGVPFPPKACRQYVEIRSSQGSHFTPGNRYNPAKDDAFAFGIQGAKLPGSPMFNAAGGTHYWRFRNVNFFTDDSGGATYSVTNATWSGGIATLTLSTSPSLATYTNVTVNGITPAGYNIGNTANTYLQQLTASAANTISYAIASNPGPYTGGGTVRVLFRSDQALSSFIQFGSGFDPNSYPDHLEIIQCGMQSDGDGDAYHGIFIGGNNVRIVDSYLGGFANPGTDITAIGVFAGDHLEVRNNYLSAVDENYGVGGTKVAAGVIPRFEYFLGNEIVKEPWMGMMSMPAGPGSLPCFQGKWFHNTTTNTDYVCGSSSGTWTAQTNLLTKVQRAPKNHWECKICQGVRIIGNDFGMIPGQSGQSAAGIVLNLVSQPHQGPCTGGMPTPCDMQTWTTIADVNIQANKFHDGFAPFSLAYSDPGFKACASINPNTHRPYAQPCYNYGHHNIAFTHNLITFVSDERSYCPSFGSGPGGYCIIAANSADQYGAMGPATLNTAEYDIDISNNTETTSKFSPNSGLMFGFGTLSGTPDSSGMVHIRNNIGPLGAYGQKGGLDAATGIYSPQNGCGLEAIFGLHGGALNLHNNILTSDPPKGHSWQSFRAGTVSPACAKADNSQAIWPKDHAGGFSWTSILDATTFKVTNPAYKGWGTDKRDPGADIDFVNWKTEHAIDGAPAPKLDYAIRSVVPTWSGSDHGVTIYFTAPSTADCTWELSPDPNRYASPIAVSSQVRNGRDGVAVWTAGTLAAGKAYWARVTCGGDQLESMVNGDRAYVITGP